MKIETDAYSTITAFDPSIPLEQLDRFANTLDSPRHRHMVQTFREHMYHEMVTLDLDALMTTLTPHPRFEFHGLPGVGHLDGYDEVRAYYEKSKSSRTSGLTVVLDRVIVDDDDLVMRGYVRCSGRFAAAAWGVEAAENAVLRKSLVVVIPFEDGLMAGEDQFFDGAFTTADVESGA